MNMINNILARLPKAKTSADFDAALADLETEFVSATAEVAKIESQNTELLEALEEIADYTISPWVVKDTAQRAIRKAKEE